MGSYDYKVKEAYWYNSNKFRVKFNTDDDEGIMDCKVIDAFDGEIYYVDGILYYKSSPSYKLSFELVDTNVGYKYPSD